MLCPEGICLGYKACRIPAKEQGKISLAGCYLLLHFLDLRCHEAAQMQLRGEPCLDPVFVDPAGPAVALVHGLIYGKGFFELQKPEPRYGSGGSSCHAHVVRGSLGSPGPCLCR